MDCLAIILTTLDCGVENVWEGQYFLTVLAGHRPQFSPGDHENTQLLAMLSSFPFGLCRASVGNGNLLLTNLRLLISICYLLTQASGITQFYI